MTPILLLAACLAQASAAADPQHVGGVDVSRWRGFNLLEKFTEAGNAPYREEDFQLIAELGFNFVRLPIDYRCYSVQGDWLRFREPVLREIDQAVAYGDKYGIHVCLNLHRAPGFCINPPAEPLNLWRDEAAQAAFAAHWAMFAKRYAHIPPQRLSFNLLNEPTRNTREEFLAVNRRAIAAIRAADPRRLIVVDGNNVGQEPTPEVLNEPNVVQSTRGYHPGSISHYKASWVKGAEAWPEPTWPPAKMAGYLYGPAKKEFQSPLVLRGDWPAGAEFSLKLERLSGSVKLQAQADGQVVAEMHCDPKDSPEKWVPLKSDLPWPTHRTKDDLRFAFSLPRQAKEVSLANVAGDWITFSRIQMKLPDEVPHTYSTEPTWGARQRTHEVVAGQLSRAPGENPNQMLVDYLQPWVDHSKHGGAVFVGEWGCFNKTPHAVTLAWMRAWLEQWKQARFGWALWNFRGSFGILDSGRADVNYEDWRGHKLDRAMLQLLQEY